MSPTPIIEKINAAIRVLLYNCFFWIPYSPAAIETSITLAVILWFLKHGILAWQFFSQGNSFISAVQKGFRPSTNPLDKPILIFLFICFVSSLLSPYSSIAVYGLITKTFEWFIIMYLVYEVIGTQRQILIA